MEFCIRKKWENTNNCLKSKMKGMQSLHWTLSWIERQQDPSLPAISSPDQLRRTQFFWPST